MIHSTQQPIRSLLRTNNPCSSGLLAVPSVIACCLSSLLGTYLADATDDVICMFHLTWQNVYSVRCGQRLTDRTGRQAESHPTRKAASEEATVEASLSNLSKGRSHDCQWILLRRAAVLERPSAKNWTGGRHWCRLSRRHRQCWQR